MTEKERIVDAIVWHVNYRLGDKGEMYVINGKLAWVGIQHKNDADLSFLESIGLEISLISTYSSITKSSERYVRILQSTSTPKKRG